MGNASKQRRGGHEGHEVTLTRVAYATQWEIGDDPLLGGLTSTKALAVLNEAWKLLTQEQRVEAMAAARGEAFAGEVAA